MAARKGHPPRSLLHPTSSDALRGAIERLRANGLSHAEAAAEIMRRNFYDFIDSETDAQSGPCHRLRIVKR
jgi:hypothetical protein